MGAADSAQSQSGPSKVVDQAQQKLGQATDKAKDAVSPMLEGAHDNMSQVAGKAKEQVGSRLGEQKDQAADSLRGVAEAFRQTSGELRNHDQSAFAQYADRAAGQIEHLATYLQQHDMDELVDDVENFARRSPTVFVGSALAVGLLAARFFKSTARRSRPTNTGWSGGSSSQSYGMSNRGGYQQFSGGQPSYGQQPYGARPQQGASQYGTQSGVGGQSSYGSRPGMGGQSGYSSSSTGGGQFAGGTPMGNSGQAPYSSQQPGGEQGTVGAGGHSGMQSNMGHTASTGTPHTSSEFELKDQDRASGGDPRMGTEGSVRPGGTGTSTAPANRMSED